MTLPVQTPVDFLLNTRGISTTTSSLPFAFFKITVSEPGTLNLSTYQSGGLLDTGLALFDSSKTLVATSDDNAGTVYSLISVPVTPGDYYVGASDYHVIYPSGTPTNFGSFGFEAVLSTSSNSTPTITDVGVLATPVSVSDPVYIYTQANVDSIVASALASASVTAIAHENAALASASVAAIAHENAALAAVGSSASSSNSFYSVALIPTSKDFVADVSVVSVLANSLDNVISATNSFGVKVNGFAGNDVITTGLGNDKIDGGDGNDTINAGDGLNVVTGGKGNDVVTTGSGNDKIDGGDDNDTIDASDGLNTVSGGKGNDVITTGSGNDKIDGGAGLDTLIGGLGNDTLTGGADADTFVLSLVSGIDTVTDFKTTVDKLVFTDSSNPIALTSSYFVSATTSIFVFADASPAFGYNTKTGALFYDADGSGVGVPVQVALIGSHAVMVASDIFVS